MLFFLALLGTASAHRLLSWAELWSLSFWISLVFFTQPLRSSMVLLISYCKMHFSQRSLYGWYDPLEHKWEVTQRSCLARGSSSPLATCDRRHGVCLKSYVLPRGRDVVFPPGEKAMSLYPPLTKVLRENLRLSPIKVISPLLSWTLHPCVFTVVGKESLIGDPQQIGIRHGFSSLHIWFF